VSQGPWTAALMAIGSRISGFLKGVFILPLLWISALSSQASELKYLTLSEATVCLAPSEVKKLKEIFDKDRVIDVEGSNLFE